MTVVTYVLFGCDHTLVTCEYYLYLSKVFFKIFFTFWTVSF